MKEEERKARQRAEEERERKRKEREKIVNEARMVFIRKLEDAMIKLDRGKLIGRFTGCLIKMFTKQAMMYSEEDIDAG